MATSTRVTSCQQPAGLSHALGRLQAVASSFGSKKPHFERGDVEAIALIKTALLDLARQEREARDESERESILATRSRCLMQRSAHALERERAELTMHAKTAALQQMEELKETLETSRGLSQSSQQEYVALREENKALRQDLESRRPQLHELQRHHAKALLQKDMAINRLQLTQRLIDRHEAAIQTTEEVIDKTSRDLVEELTKANTQKQELQSETQRVCTELRQQHELIDQVKSELGTSQKQNRELVESIRRADEVIRTSQRKEKELRRTAVQSQKTIVSLQAENVFKRQANEALRNTIERLKKTSAMEKGRVREWEGPTEDAESAQTRLAQRRKQLYVQAAQASEGLRASAKEKQDLQGRLDHVSKRLKASEGKVKILEMENIQMKQSTKKLEEGKPEIVALQNKVKSVKTLIEKERMRQETEKREKQRASEITNRIGIVRELQCQIDEIGNSINEVSADISALEDQLQALLLALDKQEYTHLETCSMLVRYGKDLQRDFEDFQRQADLELDKTTYFEAVERNMAKALAEMQMRVEQVISGKPIALSDGHGWLCQPVIIPEKSAAIKREHRHLRRSIQMMIARAKQGAITLEQSMRMEVVVSSSGSDGDSALAETSDRETSEVLRKLLEDRSGRGMTGASDDDTDWSCDTTLTSSLPKGIRYYSEIEKAVRRILGEMQSQIDKLASHQKDKEREAASLRLKIKSTKNSNVGIRKKIAKVNKGVLSQIKTFCGEKRELEVKFIITQSKIKKVDEESEKISCAGQRLQWEMGELRVNLQWNLGIIPLLREALENWDYSWRHEVTRKIGDIPSARLAILNLEVIENEVHSRMTTVGMTGEKVKAELERFEIGSQSPPPSDTEEDKSPLPSRSEPGRQQPSRVGSYAGKARVKSLTRISRRHEPKKSLSTPGRFPRASQLRTYKTDKAQNSATTIANSDKRRSHSKPAARGKPSQTDEKEQLRRQGDRARTKWTAARAGLPAKASSSPEIGLRKPLTGLASGTTTRGRTSKSEAFQPRLNKGPQAAGWGGARAPPGRSVAHHRLAGSGDAPCWSRQKDSAPGGAAKRGEPPGAKQAIYYKGFSQGSQKKPAAKEKLLNEDLFETQSNIAYLSGGLGSLINKKHPPDSDLDIISRVYTDQLFSTYLRGCRSPTREKKKRSSLHH